MSAAHLDNLVDDEMLSTTVSRLLAFSGVFLILSGMLLGDVFAVFVLHPNNARIGEALYSAAMAIPVGDTDAIMGHFQAIGGFLENRGTKVDTHAHGIAMGYLAVMLAILQPYVVWSTAAKLRIAWVYVCCAIALPFAIFTIHYVGLAFSPLASIGWASIVADTVGLIIAGIVVVQLLGLWRYWRQGGSAAPAFLQSLSRASRILLAGGALLLLAGFVYGAAYAGYSEYLQERGEVDMLRDIVTHAAAGQSVDASFAVYGGYLAFRGINAAAHAHVNSMGILLVVLALIQPFVLLSDQWKNRWAAVMVFAAVALPISILMEFKYGLIAGGVADTSGLIAMGALVAMLYGLARKTGAMDKG